MEKREERTEYVSMMVSPSVKREFEAARTNKELQETIIKNHIQSEAGWLEQELKNIDEATIKYKAKLIGIKDAFSKAQDTYVEECEKIYGIADQTIRKIDTLSERFIDSLDEPIHKVKQLGQIIDAVTGTRLHNLEKMIELAERFQRLGAQEKSLIKLLLETE